MLAPPLAPNVGMTNIAIDQLTVTWTSVPMATSYNVSMFECVCVCACMPVCISVHSCSAGSHLVRVLIATRDNREIIQSRGQFCVCVCVHVCVL